MDHIIYTAAGGAARVLEQQAVLSNNMANVSTAGFRAELAHFRSVPVVADQGLPTRVMTVTATPGSDFEQGAMTQTGDALDVAITGDGWLSVQTPTGEALTRAGQLGVNTRGELVTQQGLPVLGANGGPIDIPNRGTVTFTSDGSITVLGAGDKPNDIQTVGQLKLSNPSAASLVRGDDGLFRVQGPGAGPIQADPRVKIVSGFVESSNVSAAETMVGLIANARQYESQMQVIQTATTNADRANSILSSNG
ncbi:MAG: flagellar basal-body rod protein FlgF [Burkholderiaceae bacterium]|nr:MAG: flagellar basal-body rod protein FlgF [Burkholderiaceae bacterium]TAL99978.1 MAG: flagellar basal-body rod protein FlgF [Pusillimonas sp.]